MERDEFIDIIKDEGFAETVTVVREPGGVMETHSHPFEAKALILHGELSIRTDEAECIYRAGDVFHLAANVPHSERYGPEGVQYLVGRK